MRRPSNKEGGGLLAFRQPSPAACSDLSCSGVYEKAQVPKSLQHRDLGHRSQRRAGKRRSSSFTDGEEGGEYVPVDIPGDGYFWFKYGEKTVRHSAGTPLIRSYFRCGEQHNGRACSARKMITWDVGVRPVKFDVSYMSTHCHPPSDNPRQSIRPMRKLRIPGFATRPTGFIQPLGMNLSPRDLSCPELSHLASESLKFPGSPRNSSQLLKTDVPATRAPLCSAYMSNLSSTNEEHQPFPPRARSQIFTSFHRSQEIPDFNPCATAGAGLFSSHSMPILMVERDVDAHAFHVNRMGQAEQEQLLLKEDSASCNLEVPSDPSTAAAAENASQWQLDLLEEILALDDPIHHLTMPHVLTSESESLGRVDSSLHSGESVAESVDPASSVPSGYLCESRGATGWFGALRTETMGSTRETFHGSKKSSVEGPCTEPALSSPSIPSSHLNNSLKPEPAATGVECDGSPRRKRQSELQMKAQRNSSQQHFSHHQLVRGSMGTTHDQGAGQCQQQQQQQQQQHKQQQQQQQQIFEQKKLQKQQNLWPERLQRLRMEEQNHLQQQILQLLLHGSINLPQQYHQQNQHRQQNVQKVEPVHEKTFHVPAVEPDHGQLSHFLKMEADFDQLIHTVSRLQVKLGGSKTSTRSPWSGSSVSGCCTSGSVY